MEVFRDGKKKHTARTAILEAFIENPGRGRIFRIWDVKRERVRENSGGTDNCQSALGQSFGIDLNLAKTPGTRTERVEVEAGTIFDKTLLRLQMLRGKKSAFGPDDGLKLSHFLSNLG
jgi:hypothetical protein